ncbi:MAG: DNA polymerase II large subunit [Candidatus Heimdallarchaeota archaeon LC_2]|nr:MAG: DNA polymerase II large subunit [Candidatus Heimdallarchaeota archaeon LC_2]
MALDTKFEVNTQIKMSKNIFQYQQGLLDDMRHAMEVATNARQMGIDPKKEVEIFIAQDVATRTEGLVGPKGVAKRLQEMEGEEGLNKDQIVLQIAKEIARGNFSNKNETPEDKAEQAIRTALSYQTEGITAAPIEGIGRVEIKNNPDNSEYLVIFYSGPIRSAGGTAQGVSVFIADVVRKELGLGKYKATNDEINRILEEVRLYNRIMHLQIPTSDDELKFAWQNIPVMISGDPTEKEEVGGYRDIESMDTNKVRGGACLVINDGLVGRAKKIMKRIKALEIEGWDWLEEISQGKYSDKVDNNNSNLENSVGGRKSVKPDYSFASDALMGRPTFSGPTAKGGFRLRYGHARNTGIAALGIHPATMAVVNDYLAPGTHIRTERPGKGGITVPVDTIKPPIVKLKNGEVIEVNSYEQGKELLNDITKILFMGDLLVGFGEFLQNNYTLCPAGYNEEWWLSDLIKNGFSLSDNIKKNNPEDLQNFTNSISFEDAVKISKKYDIALHPKYVPFWEYLTVKEILELKTIMHKTQINELPLNVKRILEKACIIHQIHDDKIILSPDYFKILKLQLLKNPSEINEIEDSVELINLLSEVKIKEIMGTTIGARMGRPEKAKARKMTPALNGLFPLGNSKKVKRQLGKAKEIPFVEVYLGNRICEKCKKQQFSVYCIDCKEKTKLRGICKNRNCRTLMEEGPCENCGSSINFLKPFNLKVEELLDGVYAKMGIQNSVNEAKFKAQLNNPYGIAEIIEKGVLRAKYDLHVFRDGTIRYDATDAPLTHFYPYEIGVSVNKLKELGYEKDYLGKSIQTEDQLIELKVQDIIPNVSCISHLISVSKFIDDELEYLYNKPRYYNINNKEDIIGKLIIGLAPHTSAGVIGRVIGFTRATLCWAHPYWHAAKRRNCDGDEDGVILLLDGLLNFSKDYLPTTRGSKMDTPLVLVITLNPNEVDDEAFNVDCVTQYPLELYEYANDLGKPSKLTSKIKRIEDKLGQAEQYEGFLFTHGTKNISEGPKFTRYKNSELNIRDKLSEQLTLAELILAVDENDIALRILEKHVLPDLMGNLRAFNSQLVRCVTCNSKYRRVPLKGKCTNSDCPRSNIILTVPPRGVSKYFDICKDLVKNYNLGIYHEDRLERIQISLELHGSKKEMRQLDLNEWLG